MQARRGGTPRAVLGYKVVLQMSIERRPEAARRRRRYERIQRQLDEALADTFPASDPVSIVTSQGEEDWPEEADEPGGTPAPSATGPSAPGSSRPD